MTERIVVPPAAPPLRGHLPLLGGDGIAVTSRSLERDGRPILPVSAEVHYSRLPRESWDDELRKVRASGVTVLATYAFWIHHEQEEGRLRFDGALDLREFVRLCRAHDLDVFLRIGPFAHGEVRNGGLPDWLLAKDLVVRSDDPAYLLQTERWYRALAEQVAGIPLLAVQVENELYDDADHLRTLAALARSAGIHAPLWTGTAWGGAQLPVDELLPLYAGYSEAFWISHDAPFDASSASNFYLSDERDEVGVGADTRDSSLQPSNLDPARYPYATCELGGGMVSAYHRRPTTAPEDVAALALAKLGSGSAWQGYYMFHDGINPARGLQETHATGARNDLPELAYDFDAPYGVNGETRPSLGMLRLQHLALAAFGDRLAPLPLVLPEHSPPVGDLTGLRWSVRSDGDTGFLFAINHQPHVELPAHPGVEFEVELPGTTVRFPAVDVAPSATLWWPFRFRWHSTLLHWATAQLVTEVTWNGAPLLVLAQTPGVPARVGLEHRELLLQPGTPVPLGGGNVLLLSPEEALRAQVVDGVLVCSEAVVTADAVYAEAATVAVDSLGADGWERAVFAGAELPASVPFAVLRDATGPALVRLGPWDRASAPLPEDWASAALVRVDVRGLPASSTTLRTYLDIDWTGDAARAWADGMLVDDRYFTGRRWHLAVPPGTRELVLEVLPFGERPVFLPPWARRELGDGAARVRGIGVGRVERLDRR